MVAAAVPAADSVKRKLAASAAGTAAATTGELSNALFAPKPPSKMRFYPAGITEP
jgi:hypothetical protein